MLTTMPADEKSNSEVPILDSFKVDDERIISSIEDIVEIKGKISKFIVDTLKGSADQLDLHIGLMLYACAIHTTSKKAFRPEGELTSYTLSGKKHVVNTRDFLELLNSLPQLSGKTNKIRVFCRSFSNQYLAVCREFGEKLPKQVRGTKLGIPTQYSYLQADFISDCAGLSEVEQAVLIKGKDIALKSAAVVGTTATTNLYELGTHSRT
ncbi:CP [Tobacco virus 1]|uniref:CP n=1 Tax=Tobacco virus 1 TaxID=1692045 RepID=A0A0K1HSF4_9CLOS|nr:CP [Tobacco virus 1]AKT94763.1 CP [Tobacco virus 1]